MKALKKERLSKLQKWVLLKCLEEKTFYRDMIRQFYGKHYPPSYKDKPLNWRDEERADNKMLEEMQREVRKYDYDIGKWTDEVKIYHYKVIKEKDITTKAEESAISRTLTKMKIKGLLEQENKWRAYYLTEKGFLIVNSFHDGVTIANFKEYRNVVDQQFAESKRGYENFINSFKKPSEEYQKKAIELKSKLEDYGNKFNADTIFNICCDGCQTKIYKLQKDSGVNELKILKQEIEGLR